MRTRKRAIIKPVGQVAIQSDWVRVVRTEGDKVYPVTGAGPEDKLRVRMKVMARRNNRQP